MTLLWSPERRNEARDNRNYGHKPGKGKKTKPIAHHDFASSSSTFFFVGKNLIRRPFLGPRGGGTGTGGRVINQAWRFGNKLNLHLPRARDLAQNLPR